MDSGFWILDRFRRTRASLVSVSCARKFSPKSNTQNPKSAFTLAEVLIAIALLGALMGAMLAFGYDMLNSRARALDFAWRQRAAATLIERLESDLTAGVAEDHGQPGISGDERRLSILTRGVASSLAERDSDDADVFGDLQLAEYRFDESRGAAEARRAPFGAASGDFEFAPLGGALADVRFRYFDGSQWLSTFDSLANHSLPVAVEVSVWLERAEDTLAEAQLASAQGFDEQAFAMRENREAEGERAPDRRRVILIPAAVSDNDKPPQAPIAYARPDLRGRP